MRGHTLGGGGQEMQLLSADTFGPPDSRTTFAIISRTNTNSLPTSFLRSPLIIRVLHWVMSVSRFVWLCRSRSNAGLANFSIAD